MTNRTFLTIVTALWVILAILIIWVVLTWATKVQAADDLVCKPYASQLLDNNMSWFWERAFNHCKLLEEDRPTPPPSGDWRAALDILEPEPNHTPIPIVRPSPPPVPLAKVGVVPATDKPAPSPTKPAQAAVPVKVATASDTAATIAAKCKSAHPQGFQTGGTGGRGTYNTLVGKKWVRVPCS